MFFKVFSKTKREKEYEYIISIPSIEESCRSHSHIVNLFTEFIVKHKKEFLGGYSMQITMGS